MNDQSSPLGHYALAYAPVFNAQRQVLGTHISVHLSEHLSGGHEGRGHDALLQALRDSMPIAAGPGAPATVLEVQGPEGLHQALSTLPAPFAMDAARSNACASSSLVEAAFLRDPSQLLRGAPVMAAFERAPGEKPEPVRSDVHAVMQLLSQVDRDVGLDEIEDTLKQAPGVAFNLLRYLNSAAFGLPVEISSFRHAVMLLGKKRLKRWLALLMATAGNDTNLRPITWVAIRRGMLMEALARGLGDQDSQDELFICGLFSLLDHLVKAPMAELLGMVPTPANIKLALLERTGPYQAYLDVATLVDGAAESVHPQGFGESLGLAARNLGMGLSEVNYATLMALDKAAALGG